MCLFTNPTDVFESHPWPKRLDVCQKHISFLKLGRQRKCDSRSRALWELRSCSTEWRPRLEGWEFRWTALIVSREHSNIQTGLLVDALQQACRLLGIPCSPWIRLSVCPGFFIAIFPAACPRLDSCLRAEVDRSLASFPFFASSNCELLI
jgi:hypothetical protein